MDGFAQRFGLGRHVSPFFRWCPAHVDKLEYTFSGFFASRRHPLIVHCVGRSGDAVAVHRSKRRHTSCSGFSGWSIKAFFNWSSCSWSAPCHRLCDNVCRRALTSHSRPRSLCTSAIVVWDGTLLGHFVIVALAVMCCC